MKSPKSFARLWGTDDATILADLSGLRINRTRGLNQAWTDDRFPTAQLLNTLFSEIYIFLVDWQKSGVLEFDASVQQGYSTGALTLDINGLIRQATVANAHLVLPQDDPTEACWTILFKDPVVASSTSFGLVLVPGNGDSNPTSRELVTTVTPPNIVSPAMLSTTLSTDLSDTAITGFRDGYVTDASLSSSTLTLERNQGLADLDIDLSDVFDGYAPLSGGTFTGSIWVPTRGRSVNNTHIATTGWARRHLMTLVITASRTRRGLFQFASRLYNSLANTPSSVRTRAISPARLNTRFSLSFGVPGPVGPRGERGIVGQRGLPGVNTVGQQGPRGVGGSDASGFSAPANMYKGIPGLIGLKGQRGDAGAVGPRGGGGGRGDAGAVGPRGSVGERGLPGPSIAGADGSVGPRGEKGERGDVGPVGFRGSVGDRGLPGTSTTGRDGAVGPIGERGFVGPRGLPGRSVAGAIGPTGPAGSNSSVFFNSKRIYLNTSFAYSIAWQFERVTVSGVDYWRITTTENFGGGLNYINYLSRRLHFPRAHLRNADVLFFVPTWSSTNGYGNLVLSFKNDKGLHEMVPDALWAYVTNYGIEILTDSRTGYNKETNPDVRYILTLHGWAVTI